MPRHNPRPRPQRFLDVASITSSSLLDFLVPAFVSETTQAATWHSAPQSLRESRTASRNNHFAEYFFESLSHVATCPQHRVQRSGGRQSYLSSRAGLGARDLSANVNLRRSSRSQQHARRLSTSTKDYVHLNAGSHGGSRTESRSRDDDFRNLFDSRAKTIKSHSHLPKDFFDDVFDIQLKMKAWLPEHDGPYKLKTNHATHRLPRAYNQDHEDRDTPEPSGDLTAQLKLLRSVRDLEEKLAKAKRNLNKSLEKAHTRHTADAAHLQSSSRPSVTLTKDDYLGLVDLYYYSHRDRFHPEGRDYSPSPLFLEDYTFKLSSTYDKPESVRDDDIDAESYESPLKEIEKTFFNNQMREVSIMQKFVDQLLDETSSNRRLFHIYQQLPRPGVASLPKGVIRLFLQRMSTPWIRSEGAMLRYLTLIDDMQEAKLPVTQSEWSSAIYLAGRSFNRVTSAEVGTAISIWRRMEHEAGVKATHVTFNILFDIAVRAGKYTLAENIMKEMYARDLRLNRLGRVSLIYYHGMRNDGDAVRQTYRDFVDAGEIVDTLVMNCVIASLLNAQEPSAAEQIYERMKDLQKRLHSGTRADGSKTFFFRYPNSEPSVIEREAASNALGRILLRSAHLREILPDHHAELQDIMPLRPDHVTFRALVAYHANVTGDLDRITLLLKEMTETFELPMRNVFYLLMFKGFALHGRLRDAGERWSAKRLDLVWDACRKAIIGARESKRSTRFRPEEHVETLPPLAEVHSALHGTEQVTEVPTVVEQKRLDPWEDFVLDLAAFPRDRRKPIERVHAQLFDEEPAEKHGFLSPFLPSKTLEPPENQETFYALGNEKLDHEEGEYFLPSAARTAMGNQYRPEAGHGRRLSTEQNAVERFPGAESDTGETYANGSSHVDKESSHSRPMSGSEGSATELEESAEDCPDAGEYQQFMMHEVTGDRQTFCWLLRAYARCTCSRPKIEEIYNSIRKVWRPESNSDRMAVLRVLERCLRDCDRYGGHML